MISGLSKKPAVIGHSFGGLIVQKIADKGAAAATVTLTFEQFKYGLANNLDEAEARELCEHLPCAGVRTPV